MFQFSNIEESIEYLKKKKMISAITRAEKGSVIVNNDQVIRVSAIPVEKVIDTTAA